MGSKNNNGNEDIYPFINKLKKEDTNYARIAKGMQIFYLILMIPYMTMGVIYFVKERDALYMLGNIFIVLSFLTFALLFRNFYKEYNFVNYSLPTLEMLKRAAKRYKPFQKNTIWALLALIFMDIGLSLNSFKDNSFLSLQIIFLGAMLLGVAGGLIWWKIKYKPLRENALNLIRDIEGE
jgi:hypothetical protein